MSNKETKEVLIGLLAIAELLAVEFKDGIQAGDFASIAEKISSNEELKAKLVAAYADIEKVPSEIKGLTIAEGVDLIAAAMPGIVSLVGAIKK